MLPPSGVAPDRGYTAPTNYFVSRWSLTLARLWRTNPPVAGHLFSLIPPRRDGIFSVALFPKLAPSRVSYADLTTTDSTVSFYPHQGSRRFDKYAQSLGEDGVRTFLQHFPYGNCQRLSEPVVDYSILKGRIVEFADQSPEATCPRHVAS